jgi:hypothetical protein
LARAAFDGLDELESLDLGGNPVKVAGGTQVFCTLNNLQELLLPSSFLASLDDIGKIFSCAVNLRDIFCLLLPKY